MSAVTVTGRLSAPASASSALASALAWKEDPRPRPRPPESWWFEPPAVEEEVSAELVSALPDRITSRPDFQNLVRRDEASVLRALRRAPDARNDGDICALRCWSDGMAWLADLSLRARVALIRAALLHSVEIETAICTLQYRAPAIYVIVRGQVYIRDQFGRCMGILRSGDVFGDIAAVRHVSLDRSQIYTCVAAGHVDLALLRRAEVRCGFRDAVNKKIEDNFVLLSRTSGLKSLSTPRLRQLAELAVLKRFPRGAVLVKEHDLVDYLSIVTRGTCRKLKRFNATRSGPVVYELALGAVGPGEVLGAKCVTDAAASHDITCVVTSAECDVCGHICWAACTRTNSAFVRCYKSTSASCETRWTRSALLLLGSGSASMPRTTWTIVRCSSLSGAYAEGQLSRKASSPT